MRIQLCLTGLLAFGSIGVLSAQESGETTRRAAPEGAGVYFQAPQDGASVRSPFMVRFGLRGMGIAPAGVDLPNTGHHHLLIDVEEPPPLDMPLPATDTVRHFGLGQTEIELELPPGQHTLQLILGDWLHTPHSPPVMSQRITITVTE
jgi:hypothetical protein